MFAKKIQISGVDTSKLPMLTKKEIFHLFYQLQREGKEEAREKLVCGNLRLVLSVLQRFSNRGEYMDDIFQIGCVGLVKAIDNFDPGQGVYFSTYAVPMIIGEIKRYLRDNDSLRVSRSLKLLAQKAQHLREKFMNEKFREPTLKEMAAAMEVPPEELVLITSSSSQPISLFETVFNDSTDPLAIIDVVADEKEHGGKWLEKLSLQEALEKLKKREKRILEARFFEGKTQAQVALEVDISQAQISRIEKVALLKLRRHLGRELTEEVL